MAKKAAAKSKKSAGTTKAKSTKSAKPKTMAAKRVAIVDKTGEVFRSIVSSVLTSQKKEFTSEDVVNKSRSSARHSRRTLAFLVKNNALSVNRTERPYRYRISSREQLKRFA